MFDVQMLQRMEAVVKSQTEDSMKPKSRLHGGLFLALLTVAPRHGLQMAQEKAEYIHNKAGFPRGMSTLVKSHASIPLGNQTCTCTALYRDVLAKFVSLVSDLLLKTLAYSTIC